MKEQTVKKELLEIAKELYQTYYEVKETFDSIEEEINFLDEFFVDYRSSYSLSLAYPESLWKATAEKMGIDIKGKDRLELVKEVYSKSDSFKPPKTKLAE